MKKTFFSNETSLNILFFISNISNIFLLFARLNICLFIIAMLFYLFHDKGITSYDLFIDYWIKYQFIIIDKLSFDILSYISLLFICDYLYRIIEKYDK